MVVHGYMMRIVAHVFEGGTAVKELEMSVLVAMNGVVGVTKVNTLKVRLQLLGGKQLAQAGTSFVRAISKPRNQFVDAHCHGDVIRFVSGNRLRVGVMEFFSIRAQVALGLSGI